MFEDSLMESGNVIRTKTKYWSLLTLCMNIGALVTLIIWPLLHPQALPRQAMTTLLVAPAPPPPPPPPAPVQVLSKQAPTSVSTELSAPSKIPRPSVTQLSPLGVRDMQDLAAGMTSNPMSDIMSSVGHGPVVTPSRPQRVIISSGVMAGNLLVKAVPQYPAIAKAARIQGSVVLAATISRSGTIQHLRVVSGPAMLQQAALDAVSTWRYRPYLLNGDPVEVETTVNVIFNLGN